MIPKIIHQAAPADKDKWHRVWEKCHQSVLDRFPGFQHIMWTDADLEQLVKERHPWFMNQYLSYPENICRIDAARYVVLEKHGGIYLDMDMEVVRDFYHTLPQDKVSLVESCFQETERCQNSLMASPKGHPFWNEVMREMYSTYPYYAESVLDATGPRMLDRVVEFSPKCIHLLPSNLYNPHPSFYNKSHKQHLYTLHHYSAVWR